MKFSVFFSAILLFARTATSAMVKTPPPTGGPPPRPTIIPPSPPPPSPPPPAPPRPSLPEETVFELVFPPDDETTSKFHRSIQVGKLLLFNSRYRALRSIKNRLVMSPIPDSPTINNSVDFAFQAEVYNLAKKQVRIRTDSTNLYLALDTTNNASKNVLLLSTRSTIWTYNFDGYFLTLKDANGYYLCANPDNTGLLGTKEYSEDCNFVSIFISYIYHRGLGSLKTFWKPT